MAYVHILKGTTGRHYISATEDVDARLIRHNSVEVRSE